MKTCNKCNITKSLPEFPKHKGMSGGYRNQCKPCVALRLKVYHTNPIVIKRKQTLNATPEKKLKQKEYQSEYHSRLEVIQRRKITHRTYKQFNKAKRRAIKLKATLPGYSKDIKLIYNACPNNSHVHHIIPLCAHIDKVCGLHVPWNLEILTKEDHLKAHEELRKNFKD